MRVAFPMYDRPETAAAWDGLYGHLRTALKAGGFDLPERREQPTDLFALWQSPDLLIAQCCAFPLRARLADKVTVLGAGDHRLPGIAPGFYASTIIARPGLAIADLPGATLAINDRLSQSGYAAPLAWLDALGLEAPQRIIESGAHRASAAMVAEGRADWAALDVNSWHMIQRYDQEADRLQVLAQTPPSPALPFITAKGRDPEPLRQALATALEHCTPAERETMRLYRFIAKSEADYLH